MPISKQRRCFRLLVGSFMLAFMALPVAAQDLQCSDPEKAWLEIELIFGRNVKCGGMIVTEAGWKKFVDEEITPKFPDGLTIINAQGQWLSDDCGGSLIHEASKQVRITVPSKEAVDDEIDAIVTAYRKRFEQESVMVAARPTCVSFCRPDVCCSEKEACPFEQTK